MVQGRPATLRTYTHTYRIYRARLSIVIERLNCDCSPPSLRHVHVKLHAYNRCYKITFLAGTSEGLPAFNNGLNLLVPALQFAQALLAAPSKPAFYRPFSAACEAIRRSFTTQRFQSSSFVLGSRRSRASGAYISAVSTPRGSNAQCTRCCGPRAAWWPPAAGRAAL